MAKNTTIAVLIAALLWFGSAIIRLENQRYALELEMCGVWSPERSVERSQCLDNVRTRTSPIYNLLYGLKIL
jgi:hypothetical protein